MAWRTHWSNKEENVMALKASEISTLIKERIENFEASTEARHPPKRGTLARSSR
jgi:hypothetical protein